MAVAVRATYQTATWFQSASGSFATASASWESGDVIVVLGGLENASSSISAVSATGLTFTARNVSAGTGTGNAYARAFSAKAASGGSGVVTITRSGTLRGGAIVLVLSGADDYGSSANSSTEAVMNLTVGAGDYVATLTSDWQAIAFTAAAVAASGTGSVLVDTNDTSYAGFYVCQWVNTGAGTFGFGLNGYSGLSVEQVAIAITASAGGGSVTGTAVSAFGALTAICSGVPGVTASVATVFGGITATSSGVAGKTGAVTTAFGALSATAQGAPEKSGTIATAFGSLGATASGLATKAGTIASTFGGLTATASGMPEVAGSIASDFGALTATSIGTPDVAGSISSSFGGLTATATVVATNLWSTVTNDFSDADTDNFTTTLGTITYANNRAVLDMALQRNLVDYTDRSLIDNAAYVKVQPNPSYGYVEFQLTRVNGTALIASVYKRADQSVLNIYYNGATVATPTYDADTMKYWRYREAGGSLFIDTSGDASTWTERYEATGAASTFDLTTVELVFGFGSAVGGTPPGTGVAFAYISNLNIPDVEGSISSSFAWTATATGVKDVAGSIATGFGALTATAIEVVNDVAGSIASGFGSLTATATTWGNETNTGYSKHPSWPGSFTGGTFATEQTITGGTTIDFADFQAGVLIGTSGSKITSPVTFNGCRFQYSADVSDQGDATAFQALIFAAAGGLVTFNYCTFQPSVANYPTRLTGEEIEADPSTWVSYGKSYQFAILGDGAYGTSAPAGLVIDHCDFWGFGNALQLSGSTVANPHIVRYSWFHHGGDPFIVNTTANQYHNDCWLVNDGNYYGAECLHNTMEIWGNTNCLAWQGTGSYDDAVIVGNKFGGDQETISLSASGTSTGITFRENTFATRIGRAVSTGRPLRSWAVSDDGSGSVWARNRYEVGSDESTSNYPDAKWGNPAWDDLYWWPGDGDTTGGHASDYAAPGAGSIVSNFGGLTASAAGVPDVAGIIGSNFGALTATAIQGASSVAGTATGTFGFLSATAAGTPDVEGSISSSFGGLTAAASGSVDHSGAIATTFALASAVAGSRGVTGAIASSFGALTATAGAVIEQTGTATGSFGGLTATAAGQPGAEGSITTALGALTATATGTPTKAGTATGSLGGLAATAAGQKEVAGAIATAWGTLLGSIIQVPPSAVQVVTLALVAQGVTLQALSSFLTLETLQ